MVQPNKHLHPSIARAEHRLEEARASLEATVLAVQSGCEHPIIGECKGTFAGSWTRWRVCYACGLTVDARGCGFSADDLLGRSPEDEEFILKISHERVLQLRRGPTRNQRWYDECVQRRRAT